VLIVDDSPVSRMIVRKCLPAGHDFEVFEAADGREGVEKYRTVKPDVTFLDLTMPVMDGFQAALADIQQKTVDRVLAAGAVVVLPKPPSPESIAESLATAASFAKKQGSL